MPYLAVINRRIRSKIMVRLHLFFSYPFVNQTSLTALRGRIFKFRRSLNASIHGFQIA